jgi:carotenoid cleavage dioxygenase-like enzyme
LSHSAPTKLFPPFHSLSGITIPPNCTQPSDVLFSSTFVDTAGRQRERQLNRSSTDGYCLKYKGSLGKAPRGWPIALAMLQNMINLRTTQAQKDTCNTALAEHGGRVLALMEQSPPTEIEITQSGEVRTKECMARLDGAISPAPLTGGNLGAHGKYDYHTGQQIHVSYDASAKPYIRVDVFEEMLPTSKRRGWQRSQTVGIDIPTPVMMHDFALTSKYIVLLDFPLTVRPQRMLFDKFPVEYEPENGARIGLVPRTEDGLVGSTQDIKWYKCQPGVALHTVNAYETEDGEKVVLHAFRASPSARGSYIETQTPSCLHEWVIDLKKGVVLEQCLNPDTLVEFPIVHNQRRGRELKYSYGLRYYSIGGPLTDVIATPQDGITFDGIVKFAMIDNWSPGMRKGDIADEFTLPKNWYAVTEACVIPKTSTVARGKSSKSLENAYIALIATHVPQDDRSFLEIGSDEQSMKSHFLILDADNLGQGPVSVLELPVSVRGGLHSMWLEWEKLV